MIVEANLFYEIEVLTIKEGPYDQWATISFGQWLGGVSPLYRNYIYDILIPKLNKGFRFKSQEEANIVCKEYNKYFASNDRFSGRNFIVAEKLEKID